MRLIDADEAKKLERMVALKPSERALFRLMLDRMPTYEPPNDPLTLEELWEMDGGAGLERCNEEVVFCCFVLGAWACGNGL